MSKLIVISKLYFKINLNYLTSFQYLTVVKLGKV